MLEESVLDLRKILNNIRKFSKYPKLLQALLKGMYLVYVKSSKFIYGSNIGKNNFMKNGLLEFYSLDLNEAYKHAFVFIRQLAITIRKAFLRASKEDTRAVYNWQFICSLRFWSEFVSRNANSSELIRTLIHPLVQVILGTVSLSPGSRWIALRFHCVECLHVLAGVVQLRNRFSDDDAPADESAGMSPFGTSLVPSLPLLLDVFRLFDFNKRSSMASSAPMDLRLMLHFSPSQRRETACLDAVCSWLHDFLTEALTLYAGSVAFPEYSLPAVTEIRAFLKTCRVANFTRNFKVLVKKVTEHADFVKKETLVYQKSDGHTGYTVEAGLATATDSPLLAYYAIHRKTRVLELTALAERFKNEDTALDAEDQKSTKKTREKLPKKAQRIPGHMDDDEEEEESESSGSDSDASYDLDDGQTVRHISRSKKKKQQHKSSPDVEEGADSDAVADDDEEDSDFDLEAALNEEGEDASEHSEAEDDDELTDFRLEDFGSEEEEGTGGTKKAKKRARRDNSSHAADRDMLTNGASGDTNDDGGDSKKKKKSSGLKNEKPQKKKFGGKVGGDSRAKKLKAGSKMNPKKHGDKAAKKQKKRTA